MVKLLVAVVLAVGCKAGDKCERLYDKMLAKVSKDQDHEADPAKRDKSIASCHEDLKDPKMAKMVDCLLAIDGELTEDKTSACMDFGDRDKKQKADAGGLDKDAALAKLGDFANQMCACKDAACATKVSDAMTAWSKDMMYEEQPKLSEAETKQAADSSQRLSECMKKAMATPAPTP